MSVTVPEPEPGGEADHAVDPAGPLGPLPRLAQRQVRLEERLRRLPALGLLPDGPDLVVGQAEVVWRPSGLRRPGVVAQLSWPRLATRLAVGIETPLAHALVDRLLGYERLDVEGRLQLTPVEWGVIAFLAARKLSALAERPGPLGPWDLVLDRTGPDAFDGTDLGQIVTLRWSITIGRVTGSLRVWVPEALVALWLFTDPPEPGTTDVALQDPFAALGSAWSAEAGFVAMPRGLGKLRVGGVLPLSESRLQGTPQDLSGPVALASNLSGQAGRVSFPAEPVPHSGGGRLTVIAPARREPMPREALALNPPTDPTTAASGQAPGSIAPTDIPVTLTVELGRVNLSLSRLADLKPGDVVELGRHSREPVELTSNGRLVARGELVLIDTELGVRVTSVFL